MCHYQWNYHTDWILKKKSKVIYSGGSVMAVIFYILITILIVLFASLTYLRQAWPNISYAELMFHLKTSFDGTNPDMIYSALLKYALPAAIAVIALIVLLVFIKKKNKKLHRIIIAVSLVALITMNAISIYTYNSRTHLLTDYYNSTFRENSSTFIEDIYVDPAKVDIEFPEQKRNLIYIYLESMEMTFADEANGGAYADNYIPNLTKLSEENDDFSGSANQLNGGISLPGTNWTTAALFAETCGLPLDLPVDENTIDDPTKFFPTITTMGDILEDAGYTNTVELGSSAGFGGMGAYYRGHGSYDIHDYDYAKKVGLVPEDYYVFWGYEDEKLFEFAKQEITDLAAGGQPFNYTMFTMDTHCEDGYVCELCDDKYGDNQYANVISCSDRQVSDFVKWIQEQDFYDNTTIVISGDHPTMDADFCENISGDYQRRTYTSIINSAVDAQITEHRDYATLDLYPTILAALGVKMSSDRLGCGTNLYGTEQTIIEEFGKEKCMQEFSMGSSFVESLVNLRVTEESMKATQDSAYLEVADEDGNTRFRLVKADSINANSVRELTLVVHDKTTGETHEYEMEREISRTGWYGMSHSDFPFSNVGNIECQIYISVDDFEHYLFKDITSDDLMMWDVRWDRE